MNIFFLYIYLLYINHFPQPLGRHVSCHEMSESRSATLKDRKKIKINFPFMPLSCGLAHRHTSTLQGLHIAVAAHNCGILTKSSVHPPGTAPLISSHKIPPYTPIIHHSPCLTEIQTSFSSSIPSQYQSFFSVAYLLRNY